VSSDLSNRSSLTRRVSVRVFQVMGAEKPFTLILDDPLANSYLQNPCEPRLSNSL
jgi:C4-type Zn-finger protein